LWNVKRERAQKTGKASGALLERLKTCRGEKRGWKLKEAGTPREKGNQRERFGEPGGKMATRRQLAM